MDSLVGLLANSHHSAAYDYDLTQSLAGSHELKPLCTACRKCVTCGIHERTQQRRNLWGTWQSRPSRSDELAELRWRTLAVYREKAASCDVRFTC